MLRHAPLFCPPRPPATDSTAESRSPAQSHGLQGRVTVSRAESRSPGRSHHLQDGVSVSSAESRSPGQSHDPQGRVTVSRVESPSPGRSQRLQRRVTVSRVESPSPGRSQRLQRRVTVSRTESASPERSQRLQGRVTVFRTKSASPARSHGLQRRVSGPRTESASPRPRRQPLLASGRRPLPFRGGTCLPPVASRAGWRRPPREAGTCVEWRGSWVFLLGVQGSWRAGMELALPPLQPLQENVVFRKDTSMLTLLEPVESVRDASAVPVSFDVTYTVEANEIGTISIPVSVSSQGIVQFPPVAVPIGTWTLYWDLVNTPGGSFTISELPTETPGLSVTSQPTQLSDLQWVATVKNSFLPASPVGPVLSPPESGARLANGFGYWVQVTLPGSPPAHAHQSLAVIQGKIDGTATTLVVSYLMDPSGENRITIPVVVSQDASGIIVVQAPPVALPAQQWTLYWEFTGLSLSSVKLGKLLSAQSFAPGPGPASLFAPLRATVTNTSQEPAAPARSHLP